MEVLRRIGEHWFELAQTGGIIVGLLFTAYTTQKDERARKISNLIAIKDQHRAIWKEVHDRPGLKRILNREVDLGKQPVSEEESLFMEALILHLDTVHRAIKAGVFVNLEGLPRDVRVFFLNPIARAVWEDSRCFQDQDFVKFVEAYLE